MISVGVDIGQQQDPTAIVAVESYRPDQTPEEWKQHSLPARRHRVRHIERLPLKTDYGLVVERIATVAGQAQMLGSATIILDATGVGRPIVDMLKRSTSVSIRAVVFTSGEHETQPSYDVHRVPKRDLVTSLEVVLQARRIEFVPDCRLLEDMRAELQAYEFNISQNSGHLSFEGAAGSHDDLVSALTLAIWFGERPGLGDLWGAELAEYGAAAL
jgi:hypothetical protein